MNVRSHIFRIIIVSLEEIIIFEGISSEPMFANKDDTVEFMEKFKAGLYLIEKDRSEDFFASSVNVTRMYENRFCTFNAALLSDHIGFLILFYR